MVRTFDHPAHESHCDPEHEVADGWTIAFVRAGTFDVVVDGARERMREGSVFITRPGLAFRCEHHDECPDDVCLSVAFAPQAVTGSDDAWERAGWSARVTPTPRLAYAQRRMARAAAGHDLFEIERWALASHAALTDDARGASVRGAYAVRDPDLDAVVATCDAVERDAVARRSVAERARDVQMTSTQLTHAFRRYAGLSPHQYVVRWRLAAAAELLDDGMSVSESCYRSGFENLSHFCRTFQRALGIRASQWTALPLAEKRRKVQDLTSRRA